MKRSWKFTTTKYSSLVCQQKISHYSTKGSVQCTLDIMNCIKKLALYLKNYAIRTKKIKHQAKWSSELNRISFIEKIINYKLFRQVSKARKYVLMDMFRCIFHECDSSRSKREIYKGTMLVYYADISLKIIVRRSGKCVMCCYAFPLRHLSQDDKWWFDRFARVSYLSR